jgi:hypothetical protein
MKSKIIAVIGLLLIGCFIGGCGSRPGFHARVDSAVKPYRFSIAAWQYKAVTQQIGQSIAERNEEVESDAADVIAYFSLVSERTDFESRLRAVGANAEESAKYMAELARLQEEQDALVGTAEGVISQQIKETLAEHGIYHPLFRYVRARVSFPPPNLKLEEPPHLLVISPREKIRTIRTTLLGNDITVAEMEAVEAEVDRLGVSSVVVEIGGLGATYPTLVTNGASLPFVLDTAAHEWVHQYLVFQPLGFRFMLDITGIAPNYEIATMNETVADIVGQEISDAAIAKYYPDYWNGSQPKEKGGFDFDREMREIRKAVDQYLARGEVEEAERFMEEKRQYLAEEGYYIRKLNQAYFAFHGQYADRPAFISPIGIELKELRAKSASLKDFLDTVSGMTSRQDLKLALNNTAQE